jgi:hypothetical protein
MAKVNIIQLHWDKIVIRTVISTTWSRFVKLIHIGPTISSLLNLQEEMPLGDSVDAGCY